MKATGNHFKNWSGRQSYLFHQFCFLDSFYPDLLVLTSQTKLKEIFEHLTKYNHTKYINLTQIHTDIHMIMAQLAVLCSLSTIDPPHNCGVIEEL